MKKIIIISILLISFSAVSLSAWEPNDLTKFPACMTPSDWILNLGVSFDTQWISDASRGNDYYSIPYVRLSFDRNLPIGERKLPFFLGGIVGYSSYGYSGNNPWAHHYIPFGVRFGYHFNFGVDKLDVYAVTTAGYRIHFFTGDSFFNNRTNLDAINDFRVGVNIGARWFVSKGFGFWAEAGYVGDLNLDIGFAFKF